MNYIAATIIVIISTLVIVVISNINVFGLDTGNEFLVLFGIVCALVVVTPIVIMVTDKFITR